MREDFLLQGFHLSVGEVSLSLLPFVVSLGHGLHHVGLKDSPGRLQSLLLFELVGLLLPDGGLDLFHVAGAVVTCIFFDGGLFFLSDGSGP